MPVALDGMCLGGPCVAEFCVFGAGWMPYVVMVRMAPAEEGEAGPGCTRGVRMCLLRCVLLLGWWVAWDSMAGAGRRTSLLGALAVKGHVVCAAALQNVSFCTRVSIVCTQTM